MSTENLAGEKRAGRWRYADVCRYQVMAIRAVGHQSSGGANDTGKDNQMVARGCWDSWPGHMQVSSTMMPSHPYNP